MKVAALALACISCGGSQPATPTIKPPPSNHGPVAASTIVPEALCSKLGTLSQQKCGMFADLEMDHCTEMVKKGLDDPSNRPVLESVNECTQDLTACGDVITCIGGIESTAKQRECHEKNEDLLGAVVGVPRDAWKRAQKRGLTKFSEVKSTKAAPVEVCGIPTENAWLSALHCDDGTSPIGAAGPEPFRVGNLGDGGRCNSIIDLYRIKCPEAAYDIYLDGYVCPRP